VRLLKTALETDFCTVVYITLTLQQATQNIWSLLKKFNADHELDAKFNETKREVYLPNGSQIRLVGAADRGAGEKLRGGAYALVVLDECKSFRPAVLRELIYEVLTPALYDYVSPDGTPGGTLCMIGTPGNVLAGPFYDATTGVDPTWNFHSWTVQDNVAMPHIWQGMLRDHAARGESDDEPKWRREYLGHWIPSTELAVFKFDPARDTVGADQVHHDEDWSYILGVFIGLDGTMAAVVSAYSAHESTLRVVWDHREFGVTLTDTAKLIKQTVKRFKPEITIASTNDFNDSLINRLNLQYELDLVPAGADNEVNSLVELINTDLRDGVIKMPEGSELAHEMALLQWESSEKNKWDEDTPDQCSQAFMHAWNEAQHRFYREPEIKPTQLQLVFELERESMNKMVEKRDRPMARYEYGDSLLDEFDAKF